MDINTLLQRARSALASPTLYWLGHGGWQAREAAAPLPGRPIDLEKELEKKRKESPQVYEAYMKASAGMDRATLPKVACDCSGFVMWAIGQPRDGSVLPGGWVNTDAMAADAKGAQKLFVPLAKAVPGALLVYPKPAGGAGPGHVGIVVAADADGRATRVLHCAPDNYLLTPPPGLPRSAIAETDTKHFDAVPATRLILWKAFAM